MPLKIFMNSFNDEYPSQMIAKIKMADNQDSPIIEDFVEQTKKIENLDLINI